MWRRSGDIHIGKWKDKREVFFILTANLPELIDVPNRFGQIKIKPRAIADYNSNMSGINRCDQMIHYYSCRKTIRWYKVIFHLLDLCTWNSYFIYKKHHPKETFLAFRENVIRSLIELPEEFSCGKDLSIKDRRGRPRSSLGEDPAATPRLESFEHFPEKIPAPEGFKRKTYFMHFRD